MAGRQGRPDEELFLQKPSNEADTPTVEPLRIQKRDNMSPPPQQRQQGTMAREQQPHGSSTSLPYPDDRPQPPASLRPYSPSNRSDSSDRPKQSSPPPGGQSAAAYSTQRPELASQGRQYSGQQQGAQESQTSATSGLAARRGNAPKPLPDSPGPEPPDKEGLFARAPQRGQSQEGQGQTSAAGINPYPAYHQQYWPPSSEDRPAQENQTTNNNSSLAAPNPNSVNRLSSTASTSTTRAQRGSPPPPETPVVGPGQYRPEAGDIESRYAAAGIAGTATLNSLQARNAAASQRTGQYQAPPQAQQQQAPQDGRRPWTPTEQPGSQPYGPPTVYQGPGQATSPPPNQATHPAPGSGQGAQQGPATGSQAGGQPLEQDFQRMQLSASPPPAYSSLAQGEHGAAGGQGYPQEKRTGSAAGAAGTAAGVGATAGIAAAAAAAGASAAQAGGSQASIASGAGSEGHSQTQGHPAFANDPRQGASPQPGQESSAHQAAQAANAQVQGPGQAPPNAPASPPPLPEGWIAHLDQNSGQYYYIHLPTQSTQWEFPKGPTPLNLNEPTSPTVSAYGTQPIASPGLSVYSGKPLASPGFGSPGFPPGTPGYQESIMGMSVASPTTSAFTAPPPSSGVDMYKVAPTNGVYFGPYLRYTNMDIERGLWLGSIMLVTDAPQPPTIHIHQSVDLSPNPRQLKANPIYTHQRWVFYKYEIELQMEESGGSKWTYAITSHLGCTRYEFLVAGRHETGWRFIAHSGNDFSINTSPNERTKLGGVGYMWKDIMQKHIECGGFHAQLGLGDQIYADRLWKEIPLLKQWLGMSGKENRKNSPWTPKHDEDVLHAYFHYYTSHFDQPQLREAFAQIPHVLQLDDHDIFDGFGSYPEYMQFSNMFKNIGRIGIEMYLLFQHHTTLEILRNVSSDQDMFTITGTGWHFVKYLGPAVVVVGPDTRSERNPHQVMAGPTYQGLFPKVAMLPPSIKHCIWMVAVPLIYPRLEAAESLANTMATGKKAVTGAYNVLGKVTSSVAGVVGAKSAVGEGFNSVKKAVGKSGLMGGILSPFGDIDVLDELRDLWTHDSKDLERTYLIRTLQGIAHNKNIRMTFLSGDVNCCGAGLVHDPSHPGDHKTMYQIISSAIVSAPPSSYVLRFLHNHRALFVPQNGHRTNNQPSDTKEDMLEIFQTEGNGTARELKKLMGRRNYVAIVAYDPDALMGSGMSSYNGSVYNDAGQQGSKLSLAVDFMVQGEGTYQPPMKYGPVVIPHLEYGR